MADALRLLESIDPKDSVSWNSVLTEFSQFGLSEDVVKFFGDSDHVLFVLTTILFLQS